MWILRDKEWNVVGQHKTKKVLLKKFYPDFSRKYVKMISDGDEITSTTTKNYEHEVNGMKEIRTEIISMYRVLNVISDEKRK